MPRARRANTAPIVVSEPQRAPGVDYAETSAAPGLLMFRCADLGATLSMTGCAKRWMTSQGGGHVADSMATARQRFDATIDAVQASTHGPKQAGARRSMALARDRVDVNHAHASSLDVCRACPLGAIHAGVTPISYSPFFGSMICPRCRRGTTRMIQNRVCIGCYNRERELRKGRNARGNAPVELQRKPLHAVEMRVIVDGHPQRRRVERVVDTLEAVVQTLRTTRGQVRFAFQGSDRRIRQGRLF